MNVDDNEVNFNELLNAARAMVDGLVATNRGSLMAISVWNFESSTMASRSEGAIMHSGKTSKEELDT
jgi:hypothetical protein